MQEVTVHEAKTHLSRLLKQVETGESILIKRGDIPVARLVPVEKHALCDIPSKRGCSHLGVPRGLVPWTSVAFLSGEPESASPTLRRDSLPGGAAEAIGRHRIRSGSPSDARLRRLPPGAVADGRRL
ncbi:MAG: type II toxin-antitoxin system prevent-host-death family antitoxin [Armatimonadetes bacterium]|nr:type II toxin-antitoxin system prevent-host-death family antitoxin [Armatimonadota bacterium]